MYSLLRSIEAQECAFEEHRGVATRFMILLMKEIETQCAREGIQKTAQSMGKEFLKTAEQVMEAILVGRTGNISETHQDGQGQPKQVSKEACTHEKSGTKSLSFTDIARKTAKKLTNTQSSTIILKTHKTAKRGGEWQTITRRKADKFAQAAARQDNRVLVIINKDRKIRDCESFLMAGKLKELNTELRKALKNVQKIRSSFALTAHKNGRATLLEKK
ncbi:hypothetical protein Cpir12675_003434 [Ceratocystis pirilliformis]|uniref:Uncharacterized protein n=1 Tax=Ceratocystis pirilliformis TaxID=259994 RepID=A0ABR3Z4K1_9PEZI